ncbi:hypothetical protein AVEN_160008-1 [Araneus ventricosus]|uniref:Uncharacterized protein n=1 Tax=Araneus ventricosus TaxID=182803 RepID=A0A4Y2W3E5_ARAVE|nr:hypothetical protein AVEN_160008-1 [Araneus ventricosus]
MDRKKESTNSAALRWTSTNSAFQMNRKYKFCGSQMDKKVQILHFLDGQRNYRILRFLRWTESTEFCHVDGQKEPGIHQISVDGQSTMQVLRWMKLLRCYFSLDGQKVQIARFCQMDRKYNSRFGQKATNYRSLDGPESTEILRFSQWTEKVQFLRFHG